MAGEIKKRPGPVLFAKTIKGNTPWGKLYVTLSFDRYEPFEVFITLGKSGSELKAMTESMARLASLVLRCGGKLQDVIATLKGISGKEVWMFDHDDESIIRSLPDAVAHLLEDLMPDAAVEEDIHVPQVEKPEEPPEVEAASELVEKVEPPQKPKHGSDIPCPECGAPMELIAGCMYCYACGYSPCK